MSDLIRGGVRTAVQALVALVLAAAPVIAFLDWLEGVGFTLDVAVLEEVLIAAAAGVVAVIMNWLQKRVPWLSRFLGGAPAYSPPAPPDQA